MAKGMSNDEAIKAAVNWMVGKIESGDWLYQKVAAQVLLSAYGFATAYIDPKSGNMRITPEVLQAFLEATKDSAVWIKKKKYWRKRTALDGPGREAAN